MPDAIAQINGQYAMAFNKAGGTPWHNLGKPLEGAATSDEMLVAAGLDWDVLVQPILVHGVGDSRSALIDASIPTGKSVTVRSIDSHPLGVVGNKYQPIQNREVFEFADALVTTDKRVLFETAGALYDGRVVWALASIPDQLIRIDGDDSPIMPYLLLNTGHDGLRAFMANFTPVRVVCANTLAMALGSADNVYSIRHTVRAMDKLDEARKALRLNVEYIENLRKVGETLIKRKLTIADVIAFTEKLLPSTAAQGDSDKVVKVQKQRDSIVALYRNSQTLDGVTRPDTAWRLLQATAEWVDHDKVFRDTVKGTAADAKALALLDGTGVAIKERALNLLLPAAPKRDAKGHFIPVSKN
jgi:phage/plasmid-like protein (TIGR03299 family)